MSGASLLAPELLLLLAAACALFAEFVPERQRASALFGVVAGVLAAVGAMTLPLGEAFHGTLVFDPMARFVRVGVSLLVAAWCLWVYGRGYGITREREAVSLALFSTVGCMLMASAADLVTLFLALELATLPAYVLVGYQRSDVRNLEGALKYFLMSMLTSLVAAYGFSFLYGLSGSTLYRDFGALDRAGSLALLAASLAIIGIGAKLSAVPFHYWAPDAYEGASPISVAFISTVPKVAGAAALARLLAALAPSVPEIDWVIAALAALSMVGGNLAALTQTDIRRLMAYSGVAHTGYLLVGAATLSAVGFSSSVFYALAYAVPSLAIPLIAAEEGVTVESWDGLSSRRPGVAWMVVLYLASLIGIPPLVGFFGKFGLFSAAVARDWWWLALIGVLMSVVSAGYYLRIVRAMFFGEQPADLGETRRSVAATAALAFLALATVVAGLLSGPLAAWLAAPLK